MWLTRAALFALLRRLCTIAVLLGRTLTYLFIARLFGVEIVLEIIYSKFSQLLVCYASFAAADVTRELLIVLLLAYIGEQTTVLIFNGLLALKYTMSAIFILKAVCTFEFELCSPSY